MSTTKEKLMTNAIATVRKGGSSSLSHRDLGKTADVKSSTVHYYFPTKADLLVEAADTYWEVIDGALTQIEQANKKSLKARLNGLIDIFIDSRMQGLSCYCGSLAGEYDQLDPKVRSRVDLFFLNLEEWIVKQTKEFSLKSIAGLKPEIFARLFISALEGGVIMGRFPSQKNNLEAVREWLENIV